MMIADLSQKGSFSKHEVRENKATKDIRGSNGTVAYFFTRLELIISLQTLGCCAFGLAINGRSTGMVGARVMVNRHLATRLSAAWATNTCFRMRELHC